MWCRCPPRSQIRFAPREGRYIIWLASTDVFLRESLCITGTGLWNWKPK